MRCGSNLSIHENCNFASYLSVVDFLSFGSFVKFTAICQIWIIDFSFIGLKSRG